MTDRELPPTRAFGSVNVGEELPSLEVPITRTLIVASAIATRDYQPVHHDATIAQERGSKDVLMNILASNAFVGRFVTDWSGPEGLLRSVKLRLGVPNHPGDVMRLRGAVVATDASTNAVTISVEATNSLGKHLRATVELVLP